MQNNFTIRPLTVNQSAEALTLVTNEFSVSSPLHQATAVTPQEYQDYLSKNWQSYAFGGPVNSLGAFSSLDNRLLGCLIATRFPVSFVQLDLLPKKQKPIAALLQALELQYLQCNDYSTDSLLVDLAVVAKNQRGCGIYQQLRTAFHEAAALAGYNTVYGELSSAATQHVCVSKLGHQVVAEIHYADFQYDGRKPFASIEDPCSIQLVAASI